MLHPVCQVRLKEERGPECFTASLSHFYESVTIDLAEMTVKNPDSAGAAVAGGPRSFRKAPESI